MAVVGNRSGNIATVTITVDIAEILSLVGVSNAEKKFRAFQLARAELDRGISALQSNDAALDATVIAVTTSVANTKAARPTGSL